MNFEEARKRRVIKDFLELGFLQRKIWQLINTSSTASDVIKEFLKFYCSLVEEAGEDERFGMEEIARNKRGKRSKEDTSF